MILSGTLMAIAAGLALPGHMLLFGNVINEFVFHDIAQTLQVGLMTATAVNGTQHFCSNAGTGDSFAMSLGRYMGNSEMRDSTLLREIGRFALYYVALATGVLIATFLATVFWNISAYRQTRKMRKAFYHSILRQEIGWFDVSDANELSTRLAE